LETQPQARLVRANYNTGLGVDVFAALTSGDNNVAVGYNALTNITTGGNNTAIKLLTPTGASRRDTNVNAIGTTQQLEVQL
jgi:hypothetical protein